MRITICVLLFTAGTLLAQQPGQTVGLFLHDASRSFQGYTLFSPSNTRTTYLIDNEGEVVHTWESAYTPGQSVSLLPDGRLLHSGVLLTAGMALGGAGGVIETVDWDGKILWHYEHAQPNYRQHHDVEMMPNGNVLFLVWENHTLQEAVNWGRNPSYLTESSFWLERIVEVQPVDATHGKVVWEWWVGDHLIQQFDSTKANYGKVADHPEKIDINAGFSYADWLHFNSIRYNPKRDEIMVCSFYLSEFYIISRKTGEIVYRFGNPENYKAGQPKDRVMYGAHDARWVDGDSSRVMFFNNGFWDSPQTSRVEMVTIPFNANGTYKKIGKAFAPLTAERLFPKELTQDYFAANISGAVHLPNNNILSCFGPNGTFYESTPDGDVVWKYKNPAVRLGITKQGDSAINNQVFKIYRYPADYPGLAGKTLVRQGRLEGGSSTSVVDETFSNGMVVSLDVLAGRVSIAVATPGSYRIEAYDLIGRYLGPVLDEDLTPGTYVRTVPPGTYLLRH